MNKKFELNEIELDQIAGGRPRVLPNPPSKRFPTNQPPAPKTTVDYCVANSKKI